MKAKARPLMAKEKPRNVVPKFFETLEDMEKELEELRGGVD